MHSIFTVSVVLLFLSACSQQQFGREQARSDGAIVSRHAVESPVWPRETVEYRCQGGAELQVAYLNLKSGESFAALYYEGRLSLMRPWPAGSGARYVSMDEQVGLRWHIKEDRGVLSFLAADHTAEEITLLSDCRAVTRIDG